MASIEYEDIIENTGLGETYVEAGFQQNDEHIRITKYDDRYDCFWYTDCGVDQFVETIDKLISDNDSVDLSQKDDNQRKSMDFDMAKGYMHYQPVSYFEMNKDSITIYWIDRDGPELTQPEKIHISAPFSNIDPVLAIYPNTAPKDLETEERGPLLDEVTDYLSADQR